jgi:hypothetical protein
MDTGVSTYDKYVQLLESKRHSSQNFGIKPSFIPSGMFDFQAYISEKSIVKGRNANFIDTGLGKTYIELIHAVNYVREFNKRVLIITPLAVAFQFIKESAKFGIDDVEYSKDGKFTSKIVLCNYERLHLFDPNDFLVVILDESSILKNEEGAIRHIVTNFMRKVKYRFLFTATPSPNDFVELGTSSEALGYLGYTDMLTRFFTNNEDTISPQKIGVEWVLKGHAIENFFKWVGTWSISMRKPSDLGFSDSSHTLPELIINDHAVHNDNNLVVNGQIQLINKVARSRSEIQAEAKATIKERCEKAVSLASSYETSVYWCNLNPEGDLLENLDGNAVQLKGSMPLEKKEEILLAFADGQIKKLITKPKITAFGLNWQHCHHTVAFPTFSYEQWYQLIKRFHRFGQKHTVTADRIISDGQIRLIQAITAKGKKADELFSKLNKAVNHSYEVTVKGFDKEVQLPTFFQ